MNGQYAYSPYILPAACLLEWIAVILFLAYVGLVGVQTRQHVRIS